MQRRRTLSDSWSSVGTALAIVAVVASIGQGQDAVSLVYGPDPGHRVNRVFESEGSLRFSGIPNISDRSDGRFESMTSVTERVREVLGGGAIVSITYDSSFAQYTLGSGWIELPAEWSRLGPVRWLRDRFYVTSPLDTPSDPFFINVARGLQWTADIPLPDSTVGIGDAWEVSFPFPLTTQIPSDSALLIAAELRATGTARVDSVRQRPADTLVFVSLSAELDVTTIDGAFSYPRGDLPVTLSGTIRGSYVWSTGWYTWVSDDTRTTVEHRIDGLPRAVMWLSLVTRSRIRP